MKIVLQLTLCCMFATTVSAQRGGGGAPGGGARGGMGGGGGVRGGFGGSGSRIGGGVHIGSGFNHGGFGFRGGFGAVGGFGGFGFRSGFYGRSYGLYPYYGLGLGYSWWPSYGYPGYGSSGYYPGYSYPAYEPPGNVTVVYPQAAPAPVSVYVERATPVMHEYDASGAEVRPSSSPLYLIAFKDGAIRAASSYRVEGSTLHYVTTDREEKRVSLDTIDRSFTLQLNRERHVPFQLPE